MILQAIYLPANRCYAVLCGDTIISIGPHQQRLFSTKKELKAVLKRCGLQIGAKDIIQTIREVENEIG